jgi:L-alanine-DL-glutamate epimerase-like enolase superfamily enzyme
MWDLLGRSTGQSVSHLLGQRHTRLKACASAPPVHDEGDAAAMARELLDQGFQAIKLHSCGDVNRDVDVCEAVREAAGADVDLMMDVMAIYDRRQALTLGKVLDELEYRWYEDPLPDTDLDGWRELRGALHTPLAGVDAVRFTMHEYARPIADGAFDIVRMDAARNGISQLFGLSKLAEAFGIGCEGHAFGPALAQAANLQVSLATANAQFCELPVPLGALDHGVVAGLALDEDGYVVTPTGAGLGLEVDLEALDKAAL